MSRVLVVEFREESLFSRSCSVPKVVPLVSDVDISKAKRRLRREIRRAVEARGSEGRLEEEARLRDRLTAMPTYQKAPAVLLYVAVFVDEIDTGPLLQDVLESGRRLLLPLVDRDAWRLRLCEVRDLNRDLVVGPMGLREPHPEAPEVSPDEVAFAVVPGVAFDARGYRLGRGGGFYDRLLPLLPATAPRWALALPEQIVASVPVEPHDARVWGILLPDRVIGPGGPESSASGGLFG